VLRRIYFQLPPCVCRTDHFSGSASFRWPESSRQEMPCDSPSTLWYISRLVLVRQLSAGLVIGILAEWHHGPSLRRLQPWQKVRPQPLAFGCCHSSAQKHRYSNRALAIGSLITPPSNYSRMSLLIELFTGSMLPHRGLEQPWCSPRQPYALGIVFCVPLCQSLDS
jgi:hypothetical protein